MIYFPTLHASITDDRFLFYLEYSRIYLFNIILKYITFYKFNFFLYVRNTILEWQDKIKTYIVVALGAGSLDETIGQVSIGLYRKQSISWLVIRGFFLLRPQFAIMTHDPSIPLVSLPIAVRAVQLKHGLLHQQIALM